MFRFQRDVYLDNNATTPISRTVRNRMTSVLRKHYGNPSALYRAGRSSAVVLEASREILARTINASPQEIFFTGSATEANNTVLRMLFDLPGKKRRKIVASPIEHSSVLNTLGYLTQQGIEVAYIPVSSAGRVDPAQLADIVDEDTALVVVMLANNEIGTIQDIRSIARVAKTAGALVLSDCVQGLGKVAVDVKALDVDYASFSAHKIHGPKGVGALYVREGSPHHPFIHGGHQERGMRAGTEGLHNIAGFAAACEQVSELIKKSAGVAELRHYLLGQLKAIRPDATINSCSTACLANTISITIPDKSNAQIIAALDHYGISVAAGSACDTAEDAPSHVLKAIGLSDKQARETLRISLSTETKRQDIHYAARVFAEILAGRIPPINLLSAHQIDRRTLFDPDIYILDVRYWYDRRILRSLPNSHEISFLHATKYFHHLPKDKHILVVCQNGPNAPFVAYQLKAKGFRRISTIRTGLFGWRIAHPDLYRQFAGRNVERFPPP